MKNITQQLKVRYDAVMDRIAEQAAKDPTEWLGNKIFSGAFLLGAIMALCAVVFAGAWWHLVTAFICIVMWAVVSVEDSTEDPADIPKDEEGK